MFFICCSFKFLRTLATNWSYLPLFYMCLLNYFLLIKYKILDVPNFWSLGLPGPPAMCHSIWWILSMSLQHPLTFIFSCKLHKHAYIGEKTSLRKDLNRIELTVIITWRFNTNYFWPAYRSLSIHFCLAFPLPPLLYLLPFLHLALDLSRSLNLSV